MKENNRAGVGGGFLPQNNHIQNINYIYTIAIKKCNVFSCDFET